MASRSPWLDDDEDVQPTFKGSNRWGIDDEEEFDPNRDYLSQVVERKQDNMLESTQRSLRLLDESERVGAATGEELVRQGEVLRRTEQRVDKMEQDLKESDRHLRSIKSVWGAFMNKFSKEPPPSKPSTFDETDSSSKSLRKVIDDCDEADDQRRRLNGHPVLNRQEESRQMYSGPSSSQEQAPKNSAMQQVEDNLDLMGQSLSRLKDLGLGMQNEIDSQDPMLERLHGKVKKVDEKIHVTNKEMIKLNLR